MGKFFRSFSELRSKFGDISFQEYLSKGISHPVFYGDLVYKLRRVKDTPNFFSSGSKIVKRLRRRQYDPVIIERTIGLVLGPSTALYEPFLKHCTLTNKAVETIWRALSKPSQRRQGPDLCPLWLLVGTPSSIIPELAFSRAEHSRPYSGAAKYIFDIYFLLTMLFVYWFLWPLRLVWLLVCCLYEKVYLQIFKCVSFWLHGCCGECEGGPVNQVNHTSWVAVVTPTDRPKSVRNCCLMELFVALFLLSSFPFDISVGVGAFVIGLGQISSFLSLLLFNDSVFIELLRHNLNLFIISISNCIEIGPKSCYPRNYLETLSKALKELSVTHGLGIHQSNSLNFHKILHNFALGKVLVQTYTRGPKGHV